MNNIKQILKYWQIHTDDIASTGKTTWEADGKHILKSIQAKEVVEKNLLLSELLATEGIPVANYKKTADERIFVFKENVYWCLTNKLRGEHADAYLADSAFAIKLGRIIARLHIALKNIEGQIVCTNTDMIWEFENYIMPEINGCQQIGNDITEYIKTNLQRQYPSLPRQLIHRDMHMGNLLFEGAKLTGYIDFDLSTINSRVFDICYLLLSLLVGQTGNPERTKKWREIRRDVISGYCELSPLSVAEMEAIPLFMMYIELLFAAYWSRMKNNKYRAETIKMLAWIYKNRDSLTA